MPPQQQDLNNMVHNYPRDMVGYGEHPPHPHWPGQARICVQFVINYEEGGENNILHGDAASEAFLSEIVGAQPWQGMRHANMESLYEYGPRAGYWRLHRLFTERDMPVTVFAVASALQRNPGIVESMQRADWEIATHGLKWIDYRNHKPEAERADINAAVRIQKELTGERPLGLYQGRSSINTLDIGCEEGGFLYLADTYADELPYWIEGARGPQLVVPYTLDVNDMRFATPQGFNSGDQFFTYLKDTFDTLYAEGETAPKMMNIGLHCRLVGRPGRAAALARFLDYVRSHEHVWVARRLDIARHWVRTHPPTSGYRPSHMAEALFVEVAGRVFKHGQDVARAAYRAGFSSAEDTVEGLHAAMVSAIRTLPGDARSKVIDLHPELDLENGLTAALAARYRGVFNFSSNRTVKGRHGGDVKADFEENGVWAEFDGPLPKVKRSARLRIDDRLPERG